MSMGSNLRQLYNILTGGTAGQILKGVGGGQSAAWASELAVRVKKIAFVKKTSEFDTTWNLPADALVLDVVVEITTNAGGSSIDIGLLSTESGGDADGFIDGLSCAAALTLAGEPIVTETTGSNEVYISAVGGTIGVLLCTFAYELGTDHAYNTGYAMAYRKNHPAGAVTAKSVSYTTSDHTIAGNIYIIYVDTSEEMA